MGYQAAARNGSAMLLLLKTRRRWCAYPASRALWAFDRL